MYLSMKKSFATYWKVIKSNSKLFPVFILQSIALHLLQIKK